MDEISEAQGRNHGDQPLMALMQQWRLSNHDLVAVSSEQLTHRQVQRAKQGRQLTLRMMQKVTRAFNVAIWNRLSQAQQEDFIEYQHKRLFNYAKGYQADWQDPNEELMDAVWK